MEIYHYPPPHAVMARKEKTLPFLPDIAQSTRCSLAILDPKYKQQTQHIRLYTLLDAAERIHYMHFLFPACLCSVC